jgi:hypothetical protein
VVERQLPKLNVAGSIPVSRSMFPARYCERGPSASPLDFASGLPLRSRPLDGSSSIPVSRSMFPSFPDTCIGKVVREYLAEGRSVLRHRTSTLLA